MCDMQSNSLPQFLERLDDMGLLVRVDAKVSSELEIAEITRRVAAEGGPALLFTNVADRTLPVVTNLLGTERRVELALGVDSLAEAAEPLAQRLRQEEFVEPRVVTAAACQRVVQLGRDIQLDSLSWLRQHVDQSTATLGGAWVVTTDPTTKQSLLSRCQIIVAGRRRLQIHWSERDPIAGHYAAYRRQSERMPIAIVVGGPPWLSLIAGGPWDRRLDSYRVASCLSGKAVEVADCRTIPLQVPAEAELVIEGYVDPDWVDPDAESPDTVSPDAAEENDHQQADDDRADVKLLDTLPIDIGMVTHRTQPTLTATVAGPLVTGLPVAGGLPDEAGTLIRCSSRLELPQLKERHPALTDLVRPQIDPQRYAFVTMEKRYAEEARELATALWSETSLHDVKYLVLLDVGVDLDNEVDVWRRVAELADPRRDVIFPPANAQGEHAASLAVDATTKTGVSGRQSSSDEMDQIEMDVKADELRQLVSRRWAEYGIG